MIELCKIAGGSHLYGLVTPESDYDERYVFMNDDLSKTIGLERFEHIDNRDGTEDKFGFELRHYLQLLMKTNSQVVEIMFADEFIYIHPMFKKLIIDNRLQLLDTVRMYKSLRGYMQGELRLANGERTGVLGGKRKAALEKYGFSYKNFVQLFRLAYCGEYLIKNQFFPTNIGKTEPVLHEFLMHLKTKPEDFTKEQLNGLVAQYDKSLEQAFEDRDRTKDLTFNKDLANEIIFDFYFPVLAKHQYDKTYVPRIK